MPTFTPPTVRQASNDPFFGRYSIPVGQSVVLRDGHYVTVPYPWLGELAELTDGVTYFLGGRTYDISEAVAAALENDGFEVFAPGFGSGAFNGGLFGG